MKKWIVILCAVTLAGSVTGCGQSKESSVRQLLSEKPSGEITVSCYDTMIYKDFLEAAAKSFEAKNPGTSVKVETFAPMPEIKESQNGDSSVSIVSSVNDEQEQAGYISKINTELMSGAGADVLAADILPYYKYADGGQLEDLQAYMDADDSFKASDYRKNILDAVKYRGGQYVMPTEYMFDYLAYDASLFTENEQESLTNNKTFTWQQLLDAGKVPFERANNGSAELVSMFGDTDSSQMFRTLLRLDYGKYIDFENKKVNLKDGSFSTLLGTVKEWEDNNYFRTYPESGEFSMEDFEIVKQKRSLFKIKGSYDLLSVALRGAKVSGAHSFDAFAGNEDDDRTLGMLTNQNGTVNLNYIQAYGINSNSGNKALAWAFVKYLASEDMQSNQGGSAIGFPVNNAARMEKAKTDMIGMTGGDMNQSGDLTPEQKKIYDSYIDAVEKLSDEINSYPIKDETINAMINKELTNYLEGTKTADEAAGVLQEKIELYLNE